VGREEPRASNGSLCEHYRGSSHATILGRRGSRKKNLPSNLEPAFFPLSASPEPKPVAAKVRNMAVWSSSYVTIQLRYGGVGMDSHLSLAWYSKNYGQNFWYFWFTIQNKADRQIRNLFCLLAVFISFPLACAAAAVAAADFCCCCCAPRPHPAPFCWGREVPKKKIACSVGDGV